MKTFVLVLVLLISGIVQAQELEFGFIGNMAFKITDGKNTIFTDFPYEPGAFGYMKYDLKSIPIPENSVCLITHGHLDHWDPKLFQQLKSPKVIGPPDVVEGIDPARIISLKEMKTEYQGINVEAIETPHVPNLKHYSYLVTWQGVRMYFTGDTEDTAALLSAKNLDVAFISPWLSRKLLKDGTGVDAKKIVIYHHMDGEEFPVPKNAVVPKQGDTFTIGSQQ
jgi:L-ascorbate metabolism protein UlaG (beta-lactamase superfamily)